MSVNRKAVVIYGSTDLWDKADKLRLFYRYISHNLCAKRVLLGLDCVRKACAVYYKHIYTIMLL